MKKITATGVLAGSAVLLMIIPVMIFSVTALVEGMGVAGTIAAVGDQYVADKTNLLVVSLVGMLPLLLIAILLLVRKLRKMDPVGSAAFAWGGSIPVLIVAALVNLEYWPSYLPARQFLGFPHGLEFVIGPLFFAPIGVLFGFLIVWALRKRV